MAYTKTIHISDENHDKLEQIKHEMKVTIIQIAALAIAKFHQEYEHGLITEQDFIQQDFKEGNNNE